MGIAKAAWEQSISIPSGNPATSISLTGCSGRRSIRGNKPRAAAAGFFSEISSAARDPYNFWGIVFWKRVYGRRDPSLRFGILKKSWLLIASCQLIMSRRTPANSLKTRELFVPEKKLDKSNRSLPLTQRRALLIPLALGIVLLFGVVFSQQAFNLKQLRPDSAGQTLGLVALSALVFLLLVVLTFVLFRNLLKLYAERRLGVLGSRFRTRMVIGALVLSFAPSIVMFMFSYGLMNRSIDKWFSMPVNELQKDSGEIGVLVTSYARENARQEAVEIAASQETQHAFETANYDGVLHIFRRHQPTLQGGFALALADHESVASWNSPSPWPVLRGMIPPLHEIEGRPTKWNLGPAEFLLASAPVGKSGAILVGMPLPKDFTPALAQIAQDQQQYQLLSR